MYRLRDQDYFVYITTNPAKTVLYTGVTNDLNIRMQQHRENKGISSKGFAAKYYCYRLIYFERYPDINIAIEREKEIKLMKRETKIELIKTTNPSMNVMNVYE